jgi:hypothetical protein
MYDIARQQGVAFGYNTFANRAFADTIAFLLQLVSPGCSENRAAYAASHSQINIGRIYNGIYLHLSDVSLNNL